MLETAAQPHILGVVDGATCCRKHESGSDRAGLPSGHEMKPLGFVRRLESNGSCTLHELGGGGEHGQATAAPVPVPPVVPHLSSAPQ